MLIYYSCCDTEEFLNLNDCHLFHRPSSLWLFSKFCETNRHCFLFVLEQHMKMLSALVANPFKSTHAKSQTQLKSLNVLYFCLERKHLSTCDLFFYRMLFFSSLEVAKESFLRLWLTEAYWDTGNKQDTANIAHLKKHSFSPF